MLAVDVRTLVSGGVFTVLAVDAPSADSGLGTLANYGALGIFAGLLMVFARGAYKREAERADASNAALIKLYDLTLERFGPAFESAVRAIESSTALLGEVRAERELERREAAIRERLRGAGGPND